MNQTTPSMIQTTPQHTSLYFREGTSDKVYHVGIEAHDDGWLVTFAYGRRGNTLTTGVKTEAPVPLQTALRIYEKLVASKLDKGYRLGNDDQPAPIYHQTGNEGRDSGIRCQLLNPVEESELPRLLRDKRYCLQQKYDGRRLLVRKQGSEITGINRRGLIVALPEPIRQAVEELPFDVLIDGEAVGETLHAFDLLELKGNNIRQQGYLHRCAGLLMILEAGHPALRPVTTITDPVDKRAMFQTYRKNGCEGVVFKDLDAPFSIGRPNSGGTQLKYKFVESASFVVISRNPQRSVTLGLYDGDKLVPAGNVTIPPNHEVPAPGEVVETKYLYAYRESGSIYQPVYLGKRCDIPAAECGVDQLKYKAEPLAASA